MDDETRREVRQMIEDVIDDRKMRGGLWHFLNQLFDDTRFWVTLIMFIALFFALLYLSELYDPDLIEGAIIDAVNRRLEQSGQPTLTPPPGQ